MNWITEQGLDNVDTDTLYGTISLVPRALVDSKGLPQKSSKASTTGFYEKRNSKSQVIIHAFSQQWVPNSVILEGTNATQMSDFVLMLCNQYIKPHLKAGVAEVHVVSDSPGSLKETPKQLEQRRRDTESPAPDHQCSTLDSSTPVPSPWRSFLSCRKCKKNSD